MEREWRYSNALRVCVCVCVPVNYGEGVEVLQRAHNLRGVEERCAGVEPC